MPLQSVMNKMFKRWAQSKRDGPTPPGRVLQTMNGWFHLHPLSVIIYGSFWSFILIVASPFFGWILLFKNVAYTMDVILRFLLGIPMKSEDYRIDANYERERREKELAVCITGCDSGFGSDLAFALADRGFVVFAGCRNKQGQLQYKGSSGRIKPLQMDVTREDEILAAADTISKWVSDPTAKLPRICHALVNNAGIGLGSLVDWTDMSVYRQTMEVNFFGMVGVTKALLPIFKAQAYDGVHDCARIINVVSVAGLLAGPAFSSYSASKFAAEAFTSSLRLEMKSFDIDVVTVNPSFHKTPLTDSIREKTTAEWVGLNAETQNEYGEAFFFQLRDSIVGQFTRTLWDPNVVVKELLSSVELANPPPQIVVGTDSKFAYLLMRHFPVWAQDMCLRFLVPLRVKPAAMTKSER